MQTYKELKRKQMLKQITEEEYQQGKDAIIDSIVKQLTKEDVIIYKKPKQ